MKPLFEFSEQVRVIRTIRNDGTFYGKRRGEVLVEQGSIGYVIEWGIFLQDQIIYQVHFPQCDRIVGCRERELISSLALWRKSLFDIDDNVISKVSLAINGVVQVALGEVGRIVDIDSDDQSTSYIVTFNARYFKIPESSLMSA